MKKKIFNFPYFSIFFFYRLNIIRLDGEKCGLLGNFKTFKKMGLLPTDIQTQSRKKIFRFFHIRSGQQKYGQLGNFKTFKKIGLLATDIQTQRRKKNNFDFSKFFLFFYIRFFYRRERGIVSYGELARVAEERPLYDTTGRSHLSGRLHVYSLGIPVRTYFPLIYIYIYIYIYQFQLTIIFAPQHSDVLAMNEKI